MKKKVKKTPLIIIIISLVYCQPFHASGTEGGDTFIESLSPETKFALTQFKLGIKEENSFTLKLLPDISSAIINTKNYLIPGLEIVAVNVIVWSYDRFVLKSGWSKISMRTVLDNLKFGYEWDNNSFKANQFEHPFHGSMYHSAARIHGLSYLESAIYSFLGSFMWEFFLETNRPSANDQIMTTLGGITLGEVLFKISDLIYYQSSAGFQKILRQSLIFVINPVYGANLMLIKNFKIRDPSKKHYYDLSIPVGFYDSSTDQPIFLIAMNIEYKDALRKESSALSPYDWFSSNIMVGLNREGLKDKEVLTTGFIVGQKIRNNLVGIFGVFDYMDTQTSEMMSAVGFGPGFFTSVRSRSNLFFKLWNLSCNIWRV